jgi:glycine/D-amino acid oxidase-like deaminating enzyme
VVSYWLDHLPASARAELDGDRTADVVVIGAGFTGLWTAIELLEREPGLRIVVCEADTVGYGASGRGGGFLDPSLTHGLVNGRRHFPAEVERLDALGRENYARMRRAFAEYEIDPEFAPVGTTEVATRPHEIDGLAERAALEAEFGYDVRLLDRSQARARLESPAVLAALQRPDAGGLLDPAKLCRGLAAAAEQLGAVIVEQTLVLAFDRRRGQTRVHTAQGTIACDRIVLATDAYSGRMLSKTRRHYVPVYEYVLVSDPLRAEQLDAVGWQGREGITDSGNRFHYFRLTPDNRILWGGNDAIYYSGGRVGPRFDTRTESFTTLATNFAAMFPQLRDLAFPYRWGGAIGTTTRLTPLFGTALRDRVVYALGYTGLGVAASCFAARVLADMILAPDSDLLGLDYVRRPPTPIPPEPIRTMAVNLTRRGLARADKDGGRRGRWLRTLDRCGIGFDT